VTSDAKIDIQSQFVSDTSSPYGRFEFAQNSKRGETANMQTETDPLAGTLKQDAEFTDYQYLKIKKGESIPGSPMKNYEQF